MNVIVFGNVPLATWVIKKIMASQKMHLIGVVCDPYEAHTFANHAMEETSSYAFCIKNKITILDFEEAYAIAIEKAVFGISVRYNKIFKTSFFSAFQPGIVNLHGGELPRYRGANIANYAILENAEQGAGSIHFIAEGLDEGDIVERTFFDVSENETAHSFFIKTLGSLKEAFLRMLQKIENQGEAGILGIPQQHFINKGETARTYYKKGIEKHRYIDFTKKELSWEMIDRTARAFYFPGHQGAFLKNNDQLIELKPVLDL